MIHVRRGPAPAGLHSEEIAKLTAMLRAHHAQPPEQRGPSPVVGANLVAPRVLRAMRTELLKLFRGKCAFCETPFAEAGSAFELDRFRPCTGVSEPDGSFLPDHYWAQAFAWDNLYLCCANCHRSKANRFPLEAGSPRAPADANRRALASERPALLDPCADQPDEHLVFSVDGTVSGVTERGRATIETLDLNRSSLCAARKAVATTALSMLDKASAAERAQAAGKLARNSEASHLAVHRQILRRFLSEATERRRERSAKAAQAQHDTEREAVDTASAKGLQHFRSRARYVERVLIENIATMRRIELDLRASTADRAPCFALLGNNGVGKSSVLKALALALAGPGSVKRLGIKATKLLADGAAEGSVQVWLAGYRDPVQMRLTRRGNRIHFERPGSLQLVLGYGSSRLLPTPEHRPPTAERHAKIDNLFDPFLPLADAQAWLATPLARQRWADVAQTLALLLPPDAGLMLPKPARRTVPARLQQRGREPRLLSELSDGYQSMLGLVADILEIIYSLGWTSARSAQGVVLIDELGNHLHPAWRMRVVGALRSAFPQVQFIYSTHDPLCLRGLVQGEVAVMSLNTRRAVHMLTELPSIEGLRVDQLLTSEHFGLDSTLDPETDRDMKRYRDLLARQRLGRDEKLELEGLRKRLDDARLLGRSWRERRLLQAIDAEAASGVVPPVATPAASVSVQAMSEQTVQRLRLLMQRMKPPRAGKAAGGGQP
jgi:uncharacterized protein (TIGR02646 family)